MNEYFPAGLPLPAITDDTRPFWDNCRRRTLTVQRCGACGAFRHPPAPVCWQCRSFAHEWVPVSGRGTVFTHAVVHRAFLPALEGRVPYEPREALYGALYPQTPLEDDADAARDALALWARTERWKYVTYLKDVREADDELLKIQANLASYPEHERGDEELYDLFADPYELENLAGRPEHAETKSRLRDEALAWWRATGGGALDLP